MKKQQQTHRQRRTRTFIQAAGILQKSGIMDAFLITPGDDLQDHENFEKAAQLLGFLNSCLENNSFDEANLEDWYTLGERLLRY